jgi:hypothetical protein
VTKTAKIEYHFIESNDGITKKSEMPKIDFEKEKV